MGAHDSFNEFKQIKKVCFLLINFLIYIKSADGLLIYYGRQQGILKIPFSLLKNTYLLNIQ